VPVIMEIFRTDINAELALVQAQESARYVSALPGSAIGTEIRILQTQLGDEQQEAKSFYSQWQCQEFGRPLCTEKGHDPGPLAAAAQQGYKSATAAIAATTPRLSALQAEESEMISNDEAAVRSDRGLVASITAFEQAAGASSTIRDVQLLFFALFATVEFLPVIVRVIQVMGPQNTYEKILRLQELADIRAASQYSRPDNPGRKP